MQLGIGLIRYNMDSQLARKSKIAKCCKRTIVLVRTRLFILFPTEIIKDILQDPAILAENIYNINKTRIILSILGSIKVLVNKHDIRDYKSTRVKRITMTAIEYINSNNKYLNLMII
jgi:hypothetical protein